MARENVANQVSYENFRYLLEFSLVPSLIHSAGPKFVMAVCNTNGKLLFDIMQDYFEDMLPDVKRKNIRIFDPRRIKANSVELNDGWQVCCIEMPPDINGTSPIFCNAYYIAIKKKEQSKLINTEKVKLKKMMVVEEEYDDGWNENGEVIDKQINEDENINTDGDYIVRFFTVEEAVNKPEIIHLPIYKGIKFNRRVLCEIYANGKRKEYGETEKDMLENLIKVARIIGAIDDTSFEEKKVEVNEETGEVLNSNIIEDEDENTEKTDNAAHGSIPYGLDDAVSDYKEEKEQTISDVIDEYNKVNAEENVETETKEISSVPTVFDDADDFEKNLMKEKTPVIIPVVEENKKEETPSVNTISDTVETPVSEETVKVNTDTSVVEDTVKSDFKVSEEEKIIDISTNEFTQQPIPKDAVEKVEISINKEEPKTEEKVVETPKEEKKEIKKEEKAETKKRVKQEPKKKITIDDIDVSDFEEDLDDDFFSFDNFKEEPYSEFELWDEQFKEQRKLDDIPNPYADGDDGVSGMPDEF